MFLRWQVHSYATEYTEIPWNRTPFASRPVLIIYKGYLYCVCYVDDNLSSRFLRQVAESNLEEQKSASFPPRKGTCATGRNIGIIVYPVRGV